MRLEPTVRGAADQFGQIERFATYGPPVMT